jgi:hypothetical protein
MARVRYWDPILSRALLVRDAVTSDRLISRRDAELIGGKNFSLKLDPAAPTKNHADDTSRVDRNVAQASFAVG